eukprot:TRINITY_DN6867_c0_g1_i4.p1 TRINITY_DN6867_c0_g1~~TRINITY_DN6867_c0_g1_i4.p1  ORF type:complete len:239 (-),score=37.48 TRINITY_DN6867_c0_g1_i4:135-851(-)
MQVVDKGPFAIIDKAFEGISSCYLLPYSFFISWQGVLTLAYSGFPQPLLNLKQQLQQHCETLPPENPGSKWPKTTLGAIKDNQRLTPEQLSKLKSICLEFIDDLKNGDLQVQINDLSVVFYECRSLERLVARQNFVLEKQQISENVEEPADGEFERVQKIVNEWNDEGYWVKASKDGNRESHYKKAAAGVTLVHFLSASLYLKEIIKLFQQRVDVELPGMYTWFDSDSLHVTIRALLG